MGQVHTEIQIDEPESPSAQKIGKLGTISAGYAYLLIMMAYQVRIRASVERSAEIPKNYLIHSRITL
jgi:hypothetical protein